MAAVDDLLAHGDDKPAIGLLLCKSKNDLVAEYALRTTAMPVGVSEWKAEIVESLPEEFASTLPSIEELEAELLQTTHETPADQYQHHVDNKLLMD